MAVSLIRTSQKITSPGSRLTGRVRLMTGYLSGFGPMAIAMERVVSSWTDVRLGAVQ